jgi:hypothetical protein
MVRESKVTPSLEPNISCDNEEEYEDIYEEEDVILRRDGEIIYNALPKDMKVRSLFIKILTNAIETIEKLDEQRRLKK